MKTIMKFPVYIEIDSDNTDRRVITEAANSVLYPNLLKFLGNTQYKRSVLEQFRLAANVINIDVKLLTEIDLFKDREKTS